MAEIALRNRKREIVAIALVDDADFERVSKYQWHRHASGPSSYVAGCIQNRLVLLHRFILGLETNDPAQTDHINRNPLDNRRANLRRASVGENLQNKAVYKNSKCGHRGIYRAGPTCWRASVQRHGQRIFDGYFDSIEAAIVAVKSARANLMPFSEEALN